MESIENTLAERGSRYGVFERHAAITQGIKREMQASPNWEKLTDSMKEALEMVAHKIGRILNGDPEYLDSWHDIIGYVRLIEQELEEIAVLNREIDAVEKISVQAIQEQKAA